jgi:hypothetical protein
MKPTDKNYAGLDGFVWWMGIVESRKDPLNLGRCQVRIFGWHTEDLTDIPTEDLPWAHPVYPLNNNNFGTPRESEMVFGFFADGRNAQVPVMMGVMPTIPTEPSRDDVGFNDVRSEGELTSSPKKIQGISYGSGPAKIQEAEPQRYPVPGKPTISGLSRNDLDQGYPTYSRKNRGSVKIPTIKGGNVATPSPSYGPQYPYNNVTESESGHSLEFDDTPGKERVELNHRTGTYFEIQPDGTKVEEIVKKNYKVVMSDDHVYIMGNAIVTVDSATRIRTKGDVTVEAGNNLNLKVAGNMSLTVSGDLAMKAKNIKMESDLSSSIKSGLSTAIDSTLGTTDLKGLFGVNVSSLIGINLRAATINSLGALNFGSFSAPVANFAPPSGLTDMLPDVPDTQTLLSSISSTSSSALQSTLSNLDSSSLDGMLQEITSNDLNTMIDKLGDTFDATDLVDKMSSTGMSGLIANADSTGINNMLDNIESFGSSGLQDFMNKVPNSVTDLKNLTDKLDVSKVDSIIKSVDASGINKIMSQLPTDKVKELVGTMNSSGIRTMIGGMTGDSLIDLKSKLNSSELASISNQLSGDLKDKFNMTVDELRGKFSLSTSIEDIPGISAITGGVAAITSQTQQILDKVSISAGQLGGAIESLNKLPETLNFKPEDLAGSLGFSPDELANKLKMPIDSITQAVSLPTVDFFGILEALDIEGNFSIGDLAGSLLSISVPNPAAIAGDLAAQAQSLATSATSAITSTADSLASSITSSAQSLASSATSATDALKSSINQGIDTLKNTFDSGNDDTSVS